MSLSCLKKELVQIHSYIDFFGHNKVTEDKEYYVDSSHLKIGATPIVMERLFNVIKTRKF